MGVVARRDNAPGETKGREQHGLADRTAIQPSPRRSGTQSGPNSTTPTNQARLAASGSDAEPGETTAVVSPADVMAG
jgi:hypothetical protein